MINDFKRCISYKKHFLTEMNAHWMHPEIYENFLIIRVVLNLKVGNSFQVYLMQTILSCLSHTVLFLANGISGHVQTPFVIITSLSNLTCLVKSLVPISQFQILFCCYFHSVRVPNAAFTMLNLWRDLGPYLTGLRRMPLNQIFKSQLYETFCLLNSLKVSSLAQLVWSL